MAEDKEHKLEIITNIFAQKLSDKAATIGDITIDVVDNILSPFHQVETVLSGLFEGANIVNEENLADKKYVQKKIEGQDTLPTNQAELKKLAEKKTKLFPRYTRKFMITKTGGRGKKRKVAKKTAKRK